MIYCCKECKVKNENCTDNVGNTIATATFKPAEKRIAPGVAEYISNICKICTQRVCSLRGTEKMNMQSRNKKVTLFAQVTALPPTSVNY